jgi:hypothetical protein
MKNITRYSILILLVLAVLLPQTAQASGFQDDKVIFGGNFVLEEEETLNGTLVIFGGNATLKEGSTVNGDVVLMGGSVIAEGTINGDLVGMGGYLEVGDQATINGDLTSLGSSTKYAEEAQISGEMITTDQFPFEFSLPAGIQFSDNFPRFMNVWAGTFSRILWFLFRLLIWAGLAILITLLFPQELERVSQAAMHESATSWGMGLLVVILSPIVILLLLITILLSPLSLVAVFILFAAWVLGWSALGLEVGERLMKALGLPDWSPILYAGIGTFLVLLIMNGIRAVVPCIGWFPKLMVTSWVVGAVALTRFGTRIYTKVQTGPSTAPELPRETPPVEEQEELPSPQGDPEEEAASPGDESE